MQIATARLMDLINDDPEFRLQARHWDTRLRYQMGDDVFILVIRDGVVTEVVDKPIPFDEWRIEFVASDETWTNILTAVPRPFYQDIWSAQLYHGLRLGGDLEGMFAYFAAVRRITDLLRSLQNSTTVSAS